MYIQVQDHVRAAIQRGVDLSSTYPPLCLPPTIPIREPLAPSATAVNERSPYSLYPPLPHMAPHPATAGQGRKAYISSTPTSSGGRSGGSRDASTNTPTGGGGGGGGGGVNIHISTTISTPQLRES